ncbi:MAG: hypothetical protein DWQ01_11090 [Planctomycetota bacterium]|nr:MAG: hypothetical protein DWQ01_11090 [Planctomycetota bacterium]
MLLSHKKNFVFVHIFKTAGTSVTKVFRPHARWIDRVAHGRGRVKSLIKAGNRLAGLQHNGMRHITGFHKFATARQVRQKMGAEAFDRMFSFAFVRNPFDWVVSVYFHLKRLEDHPHHKMALDLPFPEFLEAMLRTHPKRQSDWILGEDGLPLVRHVGKMENLNQELTTICEKLSIPFEAAPHENASPGRKKDFRDYYDSHSRSLVEMYFQRDLVTFGYAFDQTQTPARPQEEAPMAMKACG